MKFRQFYLILDSHVEKLTIFDSLRINHKFSILFVIIRLHISKLRIFTSAAMFNCSLNQFYFHIRFFDPQCILQWYNVFFSNFKMYFELHTKYHLIFYNYYKLFNLARSALSQFKVKMNICEVPIIL